MLESSLWRAALLCALSFTVFKARAATTHIIPASANAYVLRSASNTDQSEAQTLATKRLDDSNTRIAYVRFDIGSFLNSNSVINLTSARLRLYNLGGASDTVKVYGLGNNNVNGVSDGAWTAAMTWNNQPAKTASPNDIGGSSSALPNANTTAQLASQSFGSTAGEVSINLSLPPLQQLLLADSNQQITLLFHNTGNNIISWASIDNTSGFLVPTLELVANDSVGTAAVLRWDGTVNGNWDTNTANWKTNAAFPSTTYRQTDEVTFDDLKAGTSTVNLTLPVTPGRITISNSSANYTFSGPGRISGIMGFTKQSAGTLTMSTSNDFGGASVISGGTFKAGHSSALGLGTGNTTISNGATLDVNGISLVSEPVRVSGAGVGGNGAVINSGAQQANALRNVTLLGETTFGGLARWDIRAANATSTSGCSLSTGGQPHKLIKLGANQVSLVAVGVDPALGHIEVRQGTFSVETATSSLGNSSYTMSVSNGATLQFYQNSVLLRKNVLLAGGAVLNNSSGANIFGGAINLAGQATFNVNSGTELIVTNNVTGSGGLTKTGAGVLRFNGSVNNYTGSTLISVGKFVANGALTGGGALTTSAGTTLAGRFTNSGPATISGAMYPGDLNLPGALGFGGLTLNPGAAVTFELFPGNTDLLQVNGNLTLNNNTLTLSPLAALQTNVPYRLVNYTGTLTGTFNPVLNLDTNFVASLEYSTPGQINIIFSKVVTFTIPTQYPTGAGPMNITLRPDGKLLYHPDPFGDIIPDFSSAGYRGSAVPIPEVPAVTNLWPVAGDNKPQIQAAIDALAGRPLGMNGFRGAIQLAAGVYEMSGGVVVNAGGIVLRGAGDGANGTILRRVVSGGDIIEIRNGPGGRSEVADTRKELTDTYVPLGAKWFRVENTTGLAVGDEIVIVRRSTSAWLAAINQPNWSAGSFNVQMMRTIVAIEGDRILVDAPLIQSIDQANGYGGGYMYKYVWPGLTQNVGVEDIRADCIVDIDTDNNTGGQFMEIVGARNCWVRRCTNDRMKGHTMKITSSAKWITVQDLVSFHNRQLADTSSANIQIHTFESSAQGLLFHRIIASHGGFEWSSGSMGSGPTVFSECTVPAAYAFSGPHMKWTVGALYDSLWMNQSLNVLKHDGSHGFGGANHLAWNCEASSYHFDRPNTAHQWNIGCIGGVNSDEPRSGALPAERLSQGKHVEPGNLFRAQLAERIGAEQVLAVLGPPDGANPFEVIGRSRSAAAGQSTNLPIILSVPPDYAGQTVTFDFSGLPAGVSGTLNSTTMNSGGTNSLNLVISNSALAGNYRISIKGSGTFPMRTGGNALITRTATAILTITGPNEFLLSASPFYQSVDPGTNTSFTVDVSGSNGFSGAVGLGVLGLPAGVSASFDPPGVTGAGVSTLTLTTSNMTPSGTYLLTIVGTNSGLVSGATVKLGVGLNGVLPDPWVDADIGAPALAGSAAYGEGTFTVKGAGTDIWNTADQFHFVSQQETGDFTLTARVKTQSNTDPWAKAGVMIRETMNAGSKYIGVYVTPTASHGVSLQYRAATGGSAVDVAQVNGPLAPYWVRLVRAGNTLSAWRSSDGVSWIQVSTNVTAINLSSNVLVGFAVTSHNPASLSTVTFENVSIDHPGFDVKASPVAQSVDGNSSAIYTVSLSNRFGFNGSVNLSLNGLPPNTTASFSPPAISGATTSFLTVNTTNITPSDTYSINIVGTNLSLTSDSIVSLTVTNTIDTDADGVPDWWSQEYFGHATGNAGDKTRATDDFDADRMSNWAEYRSGTDPTDPASYLQVMSVAAQGGDELITWSAIGGISYIVQTSTNLGPPDSFVDISPVITAQEDGPASYLNAGAATNSLSHFHRVRVVAP